MWKLPIWQFDGSIRAESGRDWREAVSPVSDGMALPSWHFCMHDWGGAGPWSLGVIGGPRHGRQEWGEAGRGPGVGFRPAMERPSRTCRDGHGSASIWRRTARGGGLPVFHPPHLGFREIPFKKPGTPG
ncbi:hypothetical protein BT67DRAFT_79346 [Trichocladium antarcticum]|uniref:Uncharacterized protein n=1 Tax=Trichocladium antarcticum TaxID=1450529 RepID=A0AAN6ZB27_9PEZI|nr:hypothetical protein BT67DRAFT_79346 [Trichocladium antarcticum]